MKDILVIEDDASMRELIGLHLTNAGYAVRLCEDAVEGGRELLRRAPVAVVCDVKMPYLDGLEFLQALKSDPAFRAIPVLLVTASLEAIEGAAAALASACLLKPVRSGDLLDAVASVLRKAA